VTNDPLAIEGRRRLFDRLTQQETAEQEMRGRIRTLDRRIEDYLADATDARDRAAIADENATACKCLRDQYQTIFDFLTRIEMWSDMSSEAYRQNPGPMVLE
jgi:hypothetical protein